MKCKIVYLLPRSGYKAPLRSDSLWAALCWAIRMLHGNKELCELIKAYNGESTTRAPFYISSAFPFLQVKNKRIPFLPRPFQPLRIELPEADAPFEQVIKQMREWKEVDKYAFMDAGLFEYAYGGGLAPGKTFPEPEVTVRPMAHNTIDRLQGSTLSINNRGQLFHTEERFIRAEDEQAKAGLYFLVKGTDDLLSSPECYLAGALRFLEHYGIGGDRSIGKGRFRIDWEDLHLPEPADANALLNLSLYHPKNEELARIQSENSPLLQYKLESRRGWKNLQSREVKKDPVLYFTERSVFPLPEEPVDVFGCNQEVGEHVAGHTIYQYGYGFMVKIKIPVT